MKRARRNSPHAAAADATTTDGGSPYSDATKAAVQTTTARIHEMHQAIAGKTFTALAQIPFVAGPAAFVRMAHDAIAGGIYAAIHHGAEGTLNAAAAIERQLPTADDDAPPGRIASGMRSVLNAAFGDHLADSGNALAIPMGIHVDGRRIALDSAALDAAFPGGGGKLALFIHGLAFDEHCWQASNEGEVDFGKRLQAQFGYTPLHLRYNTGLPIAENGARLAELLETLLAAWPEQVSSLLLIGHSMGGLVARNACEQAAAADLYWPQATNMLICLGSPHLGSPVERLGQATTRALQVSDVTAPLGTIAAARSQGIKDLRFGPGASPLTPHDIALRFIGSSLTRDTEHPLAEWFGDGLVTLGSATEHPLTGNVRSTRLGGIAHMGLLTAPRVYGQIRRWLREIEDGQETG